MQSLSSSVCVLFFVFRGPFALFPLGNGIKPSLTEGITAQNAVKSKSESADNSPLPDRINGVLRTGGQIFTAGSSLSMGKVLLIKNYGLYEKLSYFHISSALLAAVTRSEYIC